jgi:hypothetical protein
VVQIQDLIPDQDVLFQQVTDGVNRLSML